ncbi:MAG: hypothetical protein Q9191_004046 [Dirinaria sp. TL-2023a]
MLKPSQRAFVKLCGQLPPETSLWASYQDQFSVLQKAFETNWTQVYKNAFPPVLPYASSWEHGILGIYQQKQSSITILRQFEIQASAKLDTILEELRESSTGPFTQQFIDDFQFHIVTQRVLEANKLYLSDGTTSLEQQISSRDAHEAQKWCLRRLQDWCQQREMGIAEDRPIGKTIESASNDYTTIGAIITHLINRNPDHYYDWLRKDGQAIWQTSLKDEVTGREFEEWLAPTFYVMSRQDICLKEVMDSLTQLDGRDVQKYEYDTETLERSQAFSHPRSQSTEGWDVFMGYP